MLSTYFEKEIPSTFEAMNDVLDGSINALTDHCNLPENKQAVARLCLEEALVNAIRHGNDLDESRKVRLSISGNDDSCFIRIHDEGDGFSTQSINVPDCEQLGGRGLCLIQHYMDQVSYNPDEGYLEMEFKKEPFCKGC